MVITMAKLRMAHASTHGARKPPGPICTDVILFYDFGTREDPRSGSKAEDGEKERNTPGTVGGLGSRDRTLAVKSRKNVRKITFFL